MQDGPDDDIQVDLDAAPLILGGTRVIDRLVRELAAARGLDPIDVVVKLREWIDHDLGTMSV